MKHARSGFTFVELLVVIVIIGILAGLAIPRFGVSKEKAYVTLMQADLRNLETSQEAYYIDNLTYYDGSLPSPVMVYSASQGVTTTITSGSDRGWSATATTTFSARHCAVFYGNAPAEAPATVPGKVTCTN
jgi:prepilin-type N-terminal cleavage/methylation domain-containing protein